LSTVTTCCTCRRRHPAQGRGRRQDLPADRRRLDPKTN
jgi:hypothetical protein